MHGCSRVAEKVTYPLSVHVSRDTDRFTVSSRTDQMGLKGKFSMDIDRRLGSLVPSNDQYTRDYSLTRVM